MMNKLFLSFLLNLIAVAAIAQTNNKAIPAGDAQRTSIKATFLGTFTPTAVDNELFPTIQGVRDNNESDIEDVLEKYKDQIRKIKHEQGIEVPGTGNKTRGGAIIPKKVSGFKAIGNSGTPSDNTIAIGKNGQIIVAVNTSLRVYSKSGAPLQVQKTYSSFFSSVTPTNNICDPLVQYDPVADRFIVFGQTCDAVPANSKLLVAFSTTNDATGSYNYYSFSGNAADYIAGYTYGDVWFDYPKMALSGHDIFITGNLFKPTSGGNHSYKESIIYQINKSECYSGAASPQGIIFTGITYGPFTLVPVNHGRETNYGDNMYLVSTRGGIPSYTLNFYEISGAVNTSPTISAQAITVPGYAAPSDGVQKGTSVDLKTGDSRGMSAIYIDGVIHFVYHSAGPAPYYYSAINYNRIYKQGANWIADNKLIVTPNVDCAFPAVASIGWTPNDQSVLISYNYSSLNNYPGVRAVMISHDWLVGTPIELNTGTNYVDYITSNGTTRWGDYSGICRDPNNNTPTVWCFGMAGNNFRNWDNHVSEVATETWPVGLENVTDKNSNAVSIYPNPIQDIFKMRLNFEETGDLKVHVVDINGQIVKELLETKVATGETIFSFNKGALPVGNYVVRIILNNKMLANEKITVTK